MSEKLIKSRACLVTVAVFMALFLSACSSIPTSPYKDVNANQVAVVRCLIAGFGHGIAGVTATRAIRRLASLGPGAEQAVVGTGRSIRQPRIARTDRTDAVALLRRITLSR